MSIPKQEIPKGQPMDPHESSSVDTSSLNFRPVRRGAPVENPYVYSTDTSDVQSRVLPEQVKKEPPPLPPMPETSAGITADAPKAAAVPSSAVTTEKPADVPVAAVPLTPHELESHFENHPIVRRAFAVIGDVDKITNMQASLQRSTPKELQERNAFLNEAYVNLGRTQLDLRLSTLSHLESLKMRLEKLRPEAEGKPERLTALTMLLRNVERGMVTLKYGEEATGIIKGAALDATQNVAKGTFYGSAFALGNALGTAATGVLGPYGGLIGALAGSVGAGVVESRFNTPLKKTVAQIGGAAAVTALATSPGFMGTFGLGALGFGPAIGIPLAFAGAGATVSLVNYLTRRRQNKEEHAKRLAFA